MDEHLVPIYSLVDGRAFNNKGKASRYLDNLPDIPEGYVYDLTERINGQNPNVFSGGIRQTAKRRGLRVFVRNGRAYVTKADARP